MRVVWNKTISCETDIWPSAANKAVALSLVLGIAQIVLVSKFIPVTELTKWHKTTANILSVIWDYRRSMARNIILKQDWLAEHDHTHRHERRRGNRPSGKNGRRRSDAI
jgi:hypothetical protein